MLMLKADDIDTLMDWLVGHKAKKLVADLLLGNHVLLNLYSIEKYFGMFFKILFLIGVLLYVT
jgi:hypothetical protein